MKNVPLNQFIGLPFDWIEEQRASAGGRIFQSQWSMDHSVPKIAQNRPQIQKVNVRKPKILTCGLMGCNVSWFWKLAGRLFSWLVRSPKALLLETPPRRVFRFSIFWRIQISCQKKLDFFKLEELHSRATKWSKAKELHPSKMATSLRKYKILSYFSSSRFSCLASSTRFSQLYWTAMIWKIFSRVKRGSVNW